MNNISTKQFSRFIAAVSKLDPEQFVGLCTTLCVPTDECVDSTKKSREVPDVLSDVLDNFTKLPRKSRKDLLKVLELAAQ